MTLLRSLIVRSALTGALVLAGTGLSYRYWIAPAQRHQARTSQELADLRERLRSAQAEMSKTKEQEQETNRIRSGLNSLHADVPVGPAITWFPPRLKTQLSDLGVQGEVRLNSAAPEPALSNFERTYWHLSLPQQSGMRRMTDVLAAVAQIEKRDCFVKIVDLSFHAETEGPGWTAGQVNLMAFVRK